MKYLQLTKNNYSCFIKVNKSYLQENIAASLLIINDWVGDFEKFTPIRRYNMSRGKQVLIVSYDLFISAVEITEEQFNEELDKELHNYKEIMKTGDTFNIYFKKTAKRIKLLKQYSL